MRKHNQMKSTLKEYNSAQKLLRIATTMGCAVNGTAVAAVLIDQCRKTTQLRNLFFLSPTLGNTCRTYY